MMMVTAKKVEVALDVKKLSAELGATVKEGKVSVQDGKYFVTVGALNKQIVVGDTTPESEIKAMVGKPIAVVLAGRTIVAVGGLPRKPWVVCYVPVPDLFKTIREDLRAALLNRYVDAKVIPEAAAKKLQSLQV
jgi:hypothetical protein